MRFNCKSRKSVPYPVSCQHKLPNSSEVNLQLYKLLISIRINDHEGSSLAFVTFLLLDVDGYLRIESALPIPLIFATSTHEPLVIVAGDTCPFSTQ